MVNIKIMFFTQKKKVKFRPCSHPRGLGSIGCHREPQGVSVKLVAINETEI